MNATSSTFGLSEAQSKMGRFAELLDVRLDDYYQCFVFCIALVFGMLLAS